MIFSENRLPLFQIMLYRRSSRTVAVTQAAHTDSG